MLLEYHERGAIQNTPPYFDYDFDVRMTKVFTKISIINLPGLTNFGFRLPPTLCL